MEVVPPPEVFGTDTWQPEKLPSQMERIVFQPSSFNGELLNVGDVPSIVANYLLAGSTSSKNHHYRSVFLRDIW